MTNNEKIRKMKVGYTTQPGRKAYKFRPKIIMSGQWLEHAGFKIYDRYTVHVQNNMIILKKVEEAIQ